METIQKQLHEIKKLLLIQNLQQKQILTLEETAEYLNFSRSCLYKMTSKKEIPFYSPGGKKIFFLKEELHNWIIKGKKNSIYDIEEKVQNYLERTNKI